MSKMEIEIKNIIDSNRYKKRPNEFFKVKKNKFRLMDVKQKQKREIIGASDRKSEVRDCNYISLNK